MQTRRCFLTTLSLAGAAGLLRAARRLAAAGPPEITSVRFPRSPAICHAPQYVAEDLLRAEGFTDIRTCLRRIEAEINRGRLREVDFNLHFAPQWSSRIDGARAVTVLAGVHVGCFELFGSERHPQHRDLQGKGCWSGGTEDRAHHLFLAAMAAHVGLDPARTSIGSSANVGQADAALFADGKIDAFLGFPPEPQDLRARHIGHVIVNSSVDRPWSQYFCCMLAGHREFVRKYPVATKRVLRAILKAADLCASRAGAAPRDCSSMAASPRDTTMRCRRSASVPYDKWREYDAEDTIRVLCPTPARSGLIKSSPQKIIAEGTDWRFLNEVKRELKA